MKWAMVSFWVVGSLALRGNRGSGVQRKVRTPLSPSSRPPPHEIFSQLFLTFGSTDMCAFHSPPAEGGREGESDRQSL